MRKTSRPDKVELRKVNIHLYWNGHVFQSSSNECYRKSRKGHYQVQSRKPADSVGVTLKAPITTATYDIHK